MTDKQAEMPPIDFLQFIGGLNYQSQISLGMIQNPISSKYERNLDHAKYQIDLLAMLEEKTKGNLSDDEANYLKQILTDLRLRYVFECNERNKTQDTEDSKEEEK